MGTSGEARKARGVIGQIQQHSTAMELFRPARARGGLSARLVYSAWLNGGTRASEHLLCEVEVAQTLQTLGSVGNWAGGRTGKEPVTLRAYLVDRA